MKRIGLVTAMASESNSLSRVLGKRLKTDLYGDFCVETYHLNDCEIYLINSGVGEISAAAATQLLISACGAETIFNFGVSGGLSGARPAQLYIVSRVVHYDFDLSPIDDVEPARYPRFESPLIETDEKLAALAQSLFPEMQTAVCASGDKFIADEKFKSALESSYGAKLCEMESAGILLTCKINGVPSLFVKMVSDVGSAEEYTKFMSEKRVDFGCVLSKLTKKLSEIG